MASIVDFFIHLNAHVEYLFQNYQGITYFILCLILFCETGLVITPFLPGDSLLFAVGATIAKIGILNIWVAIPLIFIAVIAGDNVNYFIGSRVGVRLFNMNIPFLKREYLQRTQNFYDRHGGKTVILARFVPIVRTFAPFVAGVGAMAYKKYIIFCLIGGFIWVTGITLLGYLFGGLEIVKKHFEIVVLLIILISLLPIIYQVIFGKKAAPANG